MSEQASPGAAREMKTFFVLWAGQLVSLLGSGLTGFAVPVWIYQRTGSAEQFAFLLFAATVPALLLSPFAGALVDRWDRRKVLILSDAGSALMTVAMAVLVLTGRFEVWHLFVVASVGSAVGAFQDPAFNASITLLVPREQYARASGLMQTGTALGGVVTPLLAGVLVASVGLGGVLLLDLATFVVAMGTLLAVRIPSPKREDRGAATPAALLREAAEGWRYLSARAGLLALLLFFAVFNFALAAAHTLMQPMTLSLTTPQGLGVVASLAAVGMLVGGIVMGVWGGPRRRVNGIAGAGLFMALGVTVAGLRPSIPVIAAGLFVLTTAVPILVACSQAIWMSKTPPEVQGRVFAMRKMVAISGLPLGTLVAGPLAERVFEPLMAPGGALAGSWGRVLGVGDGRGIGLMLVLLGGVLALATLVMYLHPRIRNVETELPDVVPAHPPVAEAAAEPAVVATA